MNRTKILSYSVLVLVVTAVVWYKFKYDQMQAARQAVHKLAQVQQKRALAASSDKQQKARSASAQQKAGKVAKFPLPKNAIDAESRVKLLAAIAAKFSTENTGAEQTGDRAEYDSTVGTLSKAYIQHSIHEIMPLIKECYEMGLEQNPQLAGKITVRFTIIGDKDYGGLIEHSEVLDNSPLAANQTLRECFRETMYALKMKAPAGNGRVTVTYPFVLRPARDDGNGE